MENAWACIHTLCAQEEEVLNCKIYIDYFIESATYRFLFTSCKTLENERVSAANSFVFQSFAASFIFLSLHHNGLYTQTAQD